MSFICTKCAVTSSKSFVRCAVCFSIGTCASPSANRANVVDSPQEITSLSDVSADEYLYRDTGYSHLNDILGGGLVDGGLYVCGGPPASAKSTLWLQVANQMKREFKKQRALIVTGEETKVNVKLRAARIGVKADKIAIFSCNYFQEFFEAITDEKYCVAIFDSLQSFHWDENGRPGENNQVKMVGQKILEYAHAFNIPCIIISQLNKEDEICGPRAIEHLVDCVIFVERVLDAAGKAGLDRIVDCPQKNRFGGTPKSSRWRMTPDSDPVPGKMMEV